MEELRKQICREADRRRVTRRWQCNAAKLPALQRNERKLRVKMLIVISSAPGCSKCAQQRRALRAITHEPGVDRFDWHDIDPRENIERAVELDVTSPLSLAIDAELVFVPAPARVRAELARPLPRPDAPLLR
jgi:thioredoxin 1